MLTVCLLATGCGDFLVDSGAGGSGGGTGGTPGDPRFIASCSSGPLAAPLANCQPEPLPSTGDPYADCVTRINQLRWECQCLPGLQRWTGFPGQHLLGARLGSKRMPRLALRRPCRHGLPSGDVGRGPRRALLGTRPLHQHEQPGIPHGRLRLLRNLRRANLVGTELPVAASETYSKGPIRSLSGNRAPLQPLVQRKSLGSKVRHG